MVPQDLLVKHKQAERVEQGSLALVDLATLLLSPVASASVQGFDSDPFSDFVTRVRLPMLQADEFVALGSRFRCQLRIRVPVRPPTLRLLMSSKTTRAWRRLE